MLGLRHSGHSEDEEYSFIKSLTERSDIQSRQGDCHAGQRYKDPCGETCNFTAEYG